MGAQGLREISKNTYHSGILMQEIRSKPLRCRTEWIFRNHGPEEGKAREGMDATTCLSFPVSGHVCMTTDAHSVAAGLFCRQKQGLITCVLLSTHTHTGPGLPKQDLNLQDAEVWGSWEKGPPVPNLQSCGPCRGRRQKQAFRVTTWASCRQWR